MAVALARTSISDVSGDARKAVAVVAAHVGRVGEEGCIGRKVGGTARPPSRSQGADLTGGWSSAGRMGVVAGDELGSRPLRWWGS